MMPGNAVIINTDEALAAFRFTRLAAGAIFPLVVGNGVSLINVPVGVGKSRLVDDLLDLPELLSTSDLVIVLAAQTRNLLERRLVREPRPGVVRLRPRPRQDCGPLDAEWRRHERQGTTAFAKVHVCGHCPRRATCFWPDQYGAGIENARIIFGTHAHLLVNPRFLLLVLAVTGATRPLLILDEADVLAASYRTRLHADVLKNFLQAVRQSGGLHLSVRASWLNLTELLLSASTTDLQTDGWKFPLPSAADALAVQEAGLAADPTFRWPGYHLFAFAAARPDHRWRDHHGIVTFVGTPYFATTTLILSAGMSPLYVERQMGLGVNTLSLPLGTVRCQHHDTRVFNLCSLMGAAARFRRNHKQILDMFAQMILRNITDNKLTLLVIRKRFKRLAAEYLTCRLAGWGQPVTVLSSKGEAPEPASPTSLPLIHYGTNGVNAFENFDAVYCLSAYYIDETNLRDAIADVEDDDARFPVNIRLVGRPHRRFAGTFDDRFIASTADAIATAYYQQLETNVVIQAAGRVRFFTRPREVILFQNQRPPRRRIDSRVLFAPGTSRTFRAAHRHRVRPPIPDRPGT